jgi:hypothetical protein
MLSVAMTCAGDISQACQADGRVRSCGGGCGSHEEAGVVSGPAVPGTDTGADQGTDSIKCGTAGRNTMHSCQGTMAGLVMAAGPLFS